MKQYRYLLLFIISQLFLCLYSQDSPNSNKTMECIIKPPPFPPEELFNSYTLNQTIPMENYYVDDTNSTIENMDEKNQSNHRTHYKYSFDVIDIFLRGCDRSHGKIRSLQDKLGYSTDNIQDLDRLTSYLPKDQWLYLATLKYLSFQSYDSFITKEFKGLVIGSMEPWVEAWLVHMGFQEVVTSEYNHLTYDHPNMKTIVGGCKHMANMTEYRSYFDVIVSMSSLDHDGLGRYGDPLDPTADIKSMDAIKTLLKPNGLLFLSIPIGPDVIVWNLHRRYGKIRLPMLLKGWKEIGSIGWDNNKQMIDKPADWRKTFEPIFVLSPSDTIISNNDNNNNKQINEL